MDCEIAKMNRQVRGEKNGNFGDAADKPKPSAAVEAENEAVSVRGEKNGDFRDATDKPKPSAAVETENGAVSGRFEAQRNAAVRVLQKV